jgi:hypothetical protein
MRRTVCVLMLSSLATIRTVMNRPAVAEAAAGRLLGLMIFTLLWKVLSVNSRD